MILDVDNGSFAKKYENLTGRSLSVYIYSASAFSVKFVMGSDSIAVDGSGKTFEGDIPAGFELHISGTAASQKVMLGIR